MQINRKAQDKPFASLDAEQELRRAVMACLLWEDQFYEDGQSIAGRIEDLVGRVAPEKVASIAVEARNKHNLRHVPLLLTSALAKTASGRADGLVSDVVEGVVQRADELAELVSIYWKSGKRPLSAQLKKGLARTFNKFSAYSLAKYNRNNSVKLRDVLFLVHPKAKDQAQQKVFNQLAKNELPTPDTWEVALSGGEDKKATWERLLREGKLGYMALLRNLRNMESVGVNRSLVVEAILGRKNGAEKLLPFRFIAAARAAPSFEVALDKALLENIKELPKLKGTTAVLVDVSGSMTVGLSSKSDLSRMDAAAALASVINAEDLRVFSFSYNLKEVPARRGMAGVEAIKWSQQHGGTALAQAIHTINKNLPNIDRLIVITDEQATDGVVPQPVCKKSYMINVASYKNGVGYKGNWKHIDGFSENVIRWIYESENLD